jgi:hypothetical protein
MNATGAGLDSKRFEEAERRGGKKRLKMLDADDEKGVTLSGIPRSSYTRWAVQDYHWKALAQKDRMLRLGSLERTEQGF